MLDLTRYFATRLRARATPQRDPMPGSAQVPNSAGGFAWAVDHWTRLDRFLVLGTEGGTYYVGERQLTVENAKAAAECLAEDGPRVVARVVEISESGRAPKNDPALFVLAMAAGAADEATRRAALDALPRVARTGTHLLHWLRFVGAFRGWGRGVRRAVGAWYTHRPARELAYQLLKYPSRDGWSHRDALRLAHPKPATAEQQVLLARAVTGTTPSADGLESDAMSLVRAVDRLATETDPARAAELVRSARLTREMVPGGLLRHPEVWEALLESMPLTALVRSLAVMTRVGLVAPASDAARRVADRVSDAEAVRRARVHPVQMLSALRTYASGRGVRGSGSWVPVAQVVDALDAAFYLAFGAVEPSRRRVMLALDVSGSMTAPVHGLEGLSCREASAAMALVTAATEPRHMLTAFTTGPYRSMHARYPSGLVPLSISPRQRLDDVVRQVGGMPFGGTDCALPMVEALRHGWKVELFVVYTDSETWSGDIHPAEALRRYRDATGIPARLAVVAMASNGFSIADPDDAGMLDVVGFDAATPALIADFAR